MVRRYTVAPQAGGTSWPQTAMPTLPSYALDPLRIVGAGFLATLVATLLLYIASPLMGMRPINIAAMLGTMLIPHDPVTALWVGTAWHFANGGVFVLIYAVLLQALGMQSTGETGALFGVLLWLAGPMLIVPLLLDMHPLVRSGEIANPGVFMFEAGMGWWPAIVELLDHLVYGIIAGIGYKHRLTV